MDRLLGDGRPADHLGGDGSVSMFRKTLARAILAAGEAFALGLAVEVQLYRPRLARAPFTGAALLAAVLAIDWAQAQLSPAAPTSSSGKPPCTTS